MKKQIGIIAFLILLAAVAILLLVEASTKTPFVTPTEGQLEVATSFYVVQEIITEVGGEHVAITVTPPSGIDVHSFEPTAREIQQAYSADLFFAYGLGLDAWAERISGGLTDAGVTVIEVGEELPLMAADESLEEEEGDDHGSGDRDPHAWLDPRMMITMTEIVRDALISADPEHTNDYYDNSNRYIGQLQELDEYFIVGLESCQLSDAIVAHDAFSYLGVRYNITMHSIAGFSPDSEPSAKRLAELSEQATSLGVEYIFFESLTSPKLTETIANEIGAQTLVLNPIEGLTVDQAERGVGYIEIMQENLQNLELALDCN